MDPLNDSLTVYNWFTSRPGAVLTVACPCGKTWVIRPADVLRGVNPPYNVFEVKRRQVCKDCGNSSLNFGVTEA